MKSQPTLGIVRVRGKCVIQHEAKLGVQVKKNLLWSIWSLHGGIPKTNRPSYSHTFSDTLRQTQKGENEPFNCDDCQDTISEKSS